MAAYLAILMAVPTPSHAHIPTATSSTLSSDPVLPEAGPVDATTSGSIALSLACAAASCTISQVITSHWTLMRPLTLTIMAFVAILLSSLIRRLLIRGNEGDWASSPSPFAGAPTTP